MSEAAAPILVSGVYTQLYNEVVKPERIWKVSKYFLRRWIPHFPSPSYVWLVIGARQESYLNQKQTWFTAYDSTLARLAGLHPDTYRRTIKKEITQGQGPISYFIQKDGEPKYKQGCSTPKQEETKYTIRLDDPLTPTDAMALVYWLRRNAPEPVTPQAIKNLLEQALKLKPKNVRASNPAPSAIESAKLFSVTDVVKHVFPFVTDCKQWYETADKLQIHLTEPYLDHHETHYFWHNWLPILGPGPALLLIYLKSFCFHDKKHHEVRNQIEISSGDLETVFQVNSKTLRRWLAKLNKAVSDDNFVEAFVQILNTEKRPDQKVKTTYQISMMLPLTTADLAAYRKRVEDRCTSTEGDTDKLSVTVETGHGQIVGHEHRGNGQIVGHGGEGHRQKIGGSQTKDRTFKYYKYLLDALNLSDFEHLWEKTNQQQHLWRLEGKLALRSLAAAAADNRLEKLLTLFNIQGSTRYRIKQAGLSLEAIVAWYLYALNEAGLQSPHKFMMKRAVRGESPPDAFLIMAQLSWELWRTYAAAWQLYDWLDDEQFQVFTQLPHFCRWRDLYSHLSPDQLPFGVGGGVGELVALIPTASLGVSVPKNAPSRGQTISLALPSETEYINWKMTLSELELQMTKATFNTWLKDACLLGREEGKYVIGVRNQYARDWLQNRLVGTIARTLTAVSGETAELCFIVWNADEDVVHSLKEDGQRADTISDSH